MVMYLLGQAAVYLWKVAGRLQDYNETINKHGGIFEIGVTQLERKTAYVCVSISTS